MTLIYLADPMCSWCWGFSPAISEVSRRFGGLAPVEVVMGGLRPGTSEPMTGAMKSMIRDHWRHVEDASGQPFDFSFFDREGFVYDTEPACRATVTARALAADRTLPFLAAVQGAFYRDGRDVTDSDVLGDIAREEGFERDAFLAMYESDEARRATATDFSRSAGLGVRGFPTLLGRKEDRLVAITVGYQPVEEAARRVEGWLDAA